MSSRPRNPGEMLSPAEEMQGFMDILIKHVDKTTPRHKYNVRWNSEDESTLYLSDYLTRVDRGQFGEAYEFDFTETTSDSITSYRVTEDEITVLDHIALEDIEVDFDKKIESSVQNLGRLVMKKVVRNNE